MRQYYFMSFFRLKMFLIAHRMQMATKALHEELWISQMIYEFFLN